MASSKVQICNQALSLISQEEINSIDAPKSTLEIICAKWYDQVRRDTLAQHSWNFAQKRSLAVEVSAPAFGYEHAYQLPSNYIRIVQIGKTKRDFVTYYSDYAIENSQILINYDQGGNLPIVYTSDEQIVVKQSPWFTDVQVLALALKISPEVNRTQTEVQSLELQLKEALTIAKQLEGQESPTITIMNSKYRTGITSFQSYKKVD